MITFSRFYTKGIKYHPFCDDFGPMNFASIAKFVYAIEQEIVRSKTNALVVTAEKGRRSLTNAAFLIGAYLVLKLDMEANDAAKCFDGFDPELFEQYRDATFASPEFRLHLVDCWKGLRRAHKKAWLASPSRHKPHLWGCIDEEEYNLYEDPLNGDLHEVVPGKFVAFSGPRDLQGRHYRDDDARGTRAFAPDYYVDIFLRLGVSTVVRLNEARYDAAAFAAAGLEHYDLYFDDCTAPPDDVVARFLRIADAAPGLVAVHCKAGLGRTGTLIALWLMRTHGFAAREAMGWLRIMRPGSVIGDQQRYLCEVERRRRDPQAQRGTPRTPPLPPRRADAADAAGLAADVAAGARLRAAARARESRSWLTLEPSAAL
jgi:cell division cycle 14